MSDWKQIQRCVLCKSFPTIIHVKAGLVEISCCHSRTYSAQDIAEAYNQWQEEQYLKEPTQ